MPGNKTRHAAGGKSELIEIALKNTAGTITKGQVVCEAADFDEAYIVELAKADTAFISQFANPPIFTGIG